MIFGKIVGAILGLLVFPPWGLLVGLFVGHMFDRGLERAHVLASPEQLRAIQECFFQTVFRLLGYLAKADGRVSEAEISQAERFMTQMGLTTDHRRVAIQLFKEGKENNYTPHADLEAFRSLCGMHPNLVQLLLVYLVNMALADGALAAAEERVLKEVAGALGISAFALEQMLRMMRAQKSFRSGTYRTQEPANTLELAYQALGVSSQASDQEVKKAYRKLMSEYHPDKLIGQGVPDDMIQAATEKSQEIQKAYDAIKTARGLK